MNSPLKGFFANFVLADEINRAPAKVQSALLEAMGEASNNWRYYFQVRKTLVLATQNPIEQGDLPTSGSASRSFYVENGYHYLKWMKKPGCSSKSKGKL
jgi:MoxR-like ATPase